MFGQVPNDDTVEDLLTPKHVMEKEMDAKKGNIMSMFEQGKQFV